MKLLVIILTLVSAASSAKILIIHMIESRSHQAVFERYVNGLLQRGHQVTLVNSFPPKSFPPNYTHIDTSGKVYSMVDEFGLKNEFWINHMSFRLHLRILHQIEMTSCEGILTIPQVRELYMSEEAPFDLLVGQTYYVSCLLPIAARYKKPFIHFLTPSHILTPDIAVGNINNPSVFPSIVRDYPFPINTAASFASRLKNFVNYWHYLVNHLFVFEPSTVRLCQKYFKNVDCRLDSLFKSVRFMFSYSHSQLIPRSIVPNHAEIGGMHIFPPKSLPQDLDKFIRESKDGVVYVSFGSALKMSRSNENILNDLLKVFSNLKCNILWRSDIDLVANKSLSFQGKILTRNWFPQVDILADQNVRIFITQGGIHSIFEAIYTATPIIGLPLFFDQYDNVQKVEELGGGILVNGAKLKEQLGTAISEILQNEKYSKRMQELSKIYHDRPLNPLDTSLYWTEFVLRYDDRTYLHSTSAEIPLVQYLFLDVILIIIALVITIFYAAIKLVKVFKSKKN